MGQKITVLEWRAWNQFLLPTILGELGHRHQLDPFSEFPSELFEGICESASIVCFHINLSVRRGLPLDTLDLAQRFAGRGIYVVNGIVQDVRKSTLHAHLESIGLPSAAASLSDSPDEKVFIKTNLNYGGENEKCVPPEVLSSAGLYEMTSTNIGAYSYRTAERHTVSEDMWRDPAIVVERFITNPEDSFFRVYFSGKQVIIVKAFAPGTIKKMSSDARDTNYVSELDYLKDGSDELPISARLRREVATFVEKTPIDFGCLDIVHDGNDNHYIIDLNLTPSSGSGKLDIDLNDFLLRGITESFRRKEQSWVDTPLSAGAQSVANLAGSPSQ